MKFIKKGKNNISSFILSILLLFIIINLVYIYSIRIFAQEDEEDNTSESIYSYLTAEEAFLLITYSNLSELKKMASYLKIDFDENITLEELKKLLFEYYGFKEIKKENSTDVLLIKSTDIINISQEDRIIDLIGNNIVVYREYLFKADRIILYIDEETFFGYGSVSFKSNTLEAKARSFEYSMPKKSGKLYDATILIDKYIISTSKASISNNNILITEKATVTQCLYDDPHYYMLVNKVLYSQSMIYFYEITLVIGNEKVFYIPIYISYEKGYNYPLLFGMDYGYREGFIFFNSLIKKDYELYFDFYERLGLYIGFKSKIKFSKSEFSIFSGFSISPDLFYISDTYSWTIIPPDSPFSIKNINIRLGINGEFKFNLFNSVNGLIKYSYYSDPYFYYDFFTRERFLRFDITQFTSFDWEDDYNLFPSTNLSFVEDLRLSFKIFKYNFNISYALNFTAIKNSFIQNLNLSYYIYSPKYYIYYISSIKWYDISFSGDIISFSDKNFSFRIANSNFSNYFCYYDTDFQIQKQNFIASTSINPSFTVNFGFFYYSFSMSNLLSYNEIVADNIKETLFYYTNISNNISFHIPILRLSINIGQSYRNSLFQPVEFGWISNKATASLSFTPFNFISLSLFLNYNFIDLSNQQLWNFSIDRFDTFNINTKINFQYLNFIWDSKYYISIQRFLNHRFSMIINLPKLKIWFFSVSINNSSILNIDETNPFFSYFENNFNLNFLIEEQFQITFRVTSYNQYIYRYDSFEDAFIDLLNSFNFFDYEKRFYSNFDLRSLSLLINRYLHDMLIQFQITGSFVLSSDRTQYNFVISYSIYIVSNFLSAYKFLDSWEKTY
ncbi:MAG: hypothetical protein ACK4YF_00670 [Exilispira sp.]